MKIILIKILSLVYKLLFLIKGNNISLRKSWFYLSRINISKGNFVSVVGSDINNTFISISDSGNLIEATDALISHTSISMNGTCNKLIIEPNVKLRGANIQIRGHNCTVKIGKGTTFGGIRIINVGKNNNVIIGENCLFADFIELWASDTHSIYNELGEFINTERPVIIGNNVWVGTYVKILKGVSIGDGAIIGMNTMVTTNILPRTLNVGNPSRCIKENLSWALKYENE